MRYWQPFGISDEDAPYINGDPTIGRAGSIPPAGAFEQDQREIVNLIKYSELTPTELDVTQLFQSVRNQRVNYASAGTGSSVNHITVGFEPPLPEPPVTGTPLRIKALASNTGACVIVANGVQHSLRRADGSECEANDIRGSFIFEAIWNDTFWMMTNYRGVGGTGEGTVNNYVTKIPYTVDVSTFANQLTANFSPAITTQVPGDAIEVKLANNITSNAAIKVNSLPNREIVRPDGSPLRNGDAVAGQIMLLIYSDANKYQFSGIIPQAFTGMGVPIGCIILVLGNTAPLGTLKLNGTVIQRSQHPQLWSYANASNRIVDDSLWNTASNKLQASFSRGDGSTTFRLPDFRGEFMRALDEGRGADPSRAITNQQDQGVGQITVTGNLELYDPVFWMKQYYGPPWQIHPSGGGDQAGWLQGNSSVLTGVSAVAGPIDQYSIPMFPPLTPPGPGAVPPTTKESRITGQVTMTATGGASETRPRNVPVIACVVDG